MRNTSVICYVALVIALAAFAAAIYHYHDGNGPDSRVHLD